MYRHPGINFTIHKAQGGFVIEFRPIYDDTKISSGYSEPTPRLVIVNDVSEIGKAIEQTVVMEALRA